MADDVAAMDALFHDAPTTVRYGVGEVLYGDRRDTRLPQGPGWIAAASARDGRNHHLRRRLRHRQCRILPRGQRTGAGARARAWARFADGWKVISAHVSIEGAAS
jgi:hypothetical protein